MLSPNIFELSLNLSCTAANFFPWLVSWALNNMESQPGKAKRVFSLIGMAENVVRDNYPRRYPFFILADARTDSYFSHVHVVITFLLAGNTLCYPCSFLYHYFWLAAPKHICSSRAFLSQRFAVRMG